MEHTCGIRQQEERNILDERIYTHTSEHGNPAKRHVTSAVEWVRLKVEHFT